MTTEARSAARRWLAGLMLASAVLLILTIDRGWYPHDEGSLGQSAERVLAGEVPHRDFDELYTGLLTYIHAGAFAVGGVRLPVLRFPFLLLALGWVAALYLLARRVTPPAGAAALAFLGLAWSVPHYPASMPSWYNLFLATFGALALARWIEDRRTRWLVLAGVLGGISFLIKLSGLFFVAAGFLFLLEASRPVPADAERSAGSRTALHLAITAGLAVFVYLLWRAIAPLQFPRVVLHFVVPGGLLALGLAVREWTAPPAPARARILGLLRTAGPFAAGLLLVAGPFLAGFAAAGALDDLVRGVFITPFRRLQFANLRPPAPFWMATAVPLLVLLRPRKDSASAAWRIRGLLAAALLAAVLWGATVHHFPHRFVWQSLRSLVPLLGLATGLVAALSPARLGWTPERRLFVLLLGAVALLASLIQFPFSSPTYFLYVAPLVLLAGAAVVRAVGRTPVELQGVVAGFYVAFALFLVLPGAPIGLGFRYEGWVPTGRLSMPRGGLRVRMDDWEMYETLIPVVQREARGGKIWAGPDAPEVYFLGGFRNPTRTLFEFLDAGGGERALLERLDRDSVRLVAVNVAPSFSPRPSPALLAALAQRFPGTDTVGRFLVRWR